MLTHSPGRGAVPSPRPYSRTSADIPIRGEGEGEGRHRNSNSEVVQNRLVAIRETRAVNSPTKRASIPLAPPSVPEARGEFRTIEGCPVVTTSSTQVSSRSTVRATKRRAASATGGSPLRFTLLRMRGETCLVRPSPVDRSCAASNPRMIRHGERRGRAVLVSALHRDMLPFAHGHESELRQCAYDPRLRRAGREFRHQFTLASATNASSTGESSSSRTSEPNVST